MVMNVRELKKRAGISEAVDYKQWREVPMEEAIQLVAEFGGRQPKTEVGRGYIQFHSNGQPFLIMESLGGNEVHALVNPEFTDI